MSDIDKSKRKAGRPKKLKTEELRMGRTVYISHEEAARLDKMCETTNLSFSQLVRNAVLNKQLTVIDQSNVEYKKRIAFLLSNISNNINQIAKLGNETGIITNAMAQKLIKIIYSIQEYNENSKITNSSFQKEFVKDTNVTSFKLSNSDIIDKIVQMINDNHLNDDEKNKLLIALTDIFCKFFPKTVRFIPGKYLTEKLIDNLILKDSHIWFSIPISFRSVKRLCLAISKDTSIWNELDEKDKLKIDVMKLSNKLGLTNYANDFIQIVSECLNWHFATFYHFNLLMFKRHFYKTSNKDFILTYENSNTTGSINLSEVNARIRDFTEFNNNIDIECKNRKEQIVEEVNKCRRLLKDKSFIKNYISTKYSNNEFSFEPGIMTNEKHQHADTLVCFDERYKYVYTVLVSDFYDVNNN